MKFFLFNEIIPNTASNQEIISTLITTTIEYKILKEKFPDFIDGIITSTHLHDILFNENFTLGNCLDLIDNKEIKAYTFNIFSKYPIENHLNVDSVLSEEIDYEFILDSIGRNAFFIKIISNENGILFSLNLHNDLAKDSLEINASENSNFIIDNLYGITSNTDYVSDIINKEELSKLGNLDKLKRILNNPTYSNKFKNEFNKVSKEIQDLLIEGFENIIDYQNRGFNIPETLLKDVTPEREKKITVKELKVRDPIAKRLYFSEISGIYYLASLENKPLKDGESKEQRSHIKNAVSTLKELIN